MLVRIVLAALALLGFAGVAHAGEKVLYQPAPDWAVPAPAIDQAKLTGSDLVFVMLDRQQRLSIGGQTESYSVMVMRMATPQVLTAAGTIQVPWNPAKGDLIIHSVEILRGDERIDVLGAGQRFTVLQREQKLEMASLDGMRTATMPVEGLRVGDLVRIVFTITEKDTTLGNNLQISEPLIPGDTIRMLYGRERILWPVGMNLQWRIYMPNVPTQTSEKGGYRDMTITYPLAKKPDMPGDAPMRFQQMPLIEATSFENWAGVVKTMAPLYATENTIKPGSPLAAEVAKIAAASTDPRVRTAMALQLVQEKVRYLFRGMDDGNYVPQTPEQTWELRYGDCKAKSLLLVAMLRALGIEADPALVSLTLKDVTVNRLPMPGAFDHVIARVKLGNDTLWLDGTMTGSRIEDLNDVPPYRYALPLRDGVTDLVAMPLRANARPETDIAIEVDYRAGLGLYAPVKVTATIRGTTAEMMRMMMAQGSDDMKKTAISGMLAAYTMGATILDSDATFDEASGTVRVTASGVLTFGWSSERGRQKFALDSWIADMSFTPDRARAAWKEIPVTTSPEDRRVKLTVLLPDGGKDFALEGNQTLPASIAGIATTRTTSLTNGVVTMDERVTSGIAEIAPADIPVARQQVSQAKARALKLVAPEAVPSTATLIAAARRDKRFEPLLAIYAKRIARDPDDAEGYLLRGRFLRSIHDLPGALRDYDSAVKISPGPDTLVIRGRLRWELKDDKGAEADYRAALEIDPADASAISGLSTLLATQGKFDPALSLVEERIDSSSSDERLGFVLQRATLLGMAGRVDEGTALLDAEIENKPGSPLLLNARCWYKGTNNVDLENALKDCTKAIDLEDDPSNVLDSRALVYLRLGRLPEALADLDAALKRSPDLAASLFVRGVIYKRMGDKRADADLAAARFLEPRIDENYARWGVKP